MVCGHAQLRHEQEDDGGSRGFGQLFWRLGRYQRRRSRRKSEDSGDDPDERTRVLGLLESFRRRKQQPSLPTTDLQAVRQQSRARELPAGIGFAVIDVETTGLSAGRDRVVEIAVVKAACPAGSSTPGPR